MDTHVTDTHPLTNINDTKPKHIKGKIQIKTFKK